MPPRWIKFLDRPRLAFWLLCVAAALLFAGAYAGRIHVGADSWAFRSSHGARLVCFFLFSLTYWTMTARWARMHDRPARRALFILYLLAAIALFAPEIGSDGSAYYAQLRSLVVDRDLNFYNEIAGHPQLWSESELDSLNERGYTYVGFPIGPAIFWLPFFALGHLHALAANGLGTRVLCDGYSDPYRWWTLGSTVLYGFAGAALCYRLLRRSASPAAALWGTLFATLGTPLLSYLFVEPSFSHALSFMLSAAFLVYWSERFDVPREAFPTGWRPYLVLGWLLGLLALVRWQNVLIAAIPAMDATRLLVLHTRARRWPELGRALLRFGALALAALAGFLPQMLVWKMITGSSLVVPQGEGYIDWAQWNTWRVLIHPLHGLFSMHPLALLGLLGLFLGARRHPRLCIYGLVVFGLQLAINSVVHDWWAGGAFGQRRLDSAFPVIGLGLAWMIDALTVRAESPAAVRRIGARLACLGLLLLLIWNFMLLAEYRIGPLGTLGPLNREVLLSPFGELGWNKLADFVVYRPIFRGLWGGIFHADAALLFAGLLPAVLLGLGFFFVLIRLRAWRTWPRRLEAGASVATMGCSLWLLCQAMHGVETRTALDLRPAQHLGNIVDLSVNRGRAYQGGLSVFALQPGESRQADFTRRVVADRMELVAYLAEPSLPEGSDASLRIELLTEDGQALPLDFRCPEDVDRFDAERFLASPHQLARTAQIARSWTPSPDSLYLWHSYHCIRRLGAPTRLVGLRATSLLADGTVHVEGIAFNHAEGRNADHPEPARFLTLSLAPIANADYKHNPFVPHGEYEPHYGFSEGLLYWGAEPFMIPRSLHDGGDWSIFTTCSRERQDAELALPAQPLSRIDLLVCGGLIRKREVYDLVEVSARYVDGSSEAKVLAANRDVWDYLDPYAPPDRLVVGQARAYQYDGPLYVVSLALSRPGVPVEALSFRDLRADRPEGVTFFAATAVRSAPVGQPAVLSADGAVWQGPARLRPPDVDPSRRAVDLAASPEGRGFYVLFSDGTVEGVGTRERLHAGPVPEAERIEPVAGGCVVMDGSGGLHSFGRVPPLAGLALGEGLAADFVLSPQGDGWFILDRYGAVHAGGRASPLGPGPYFKEPIAVDLAWSYDRFGLYVLDESGAVSRIGAAPYFGRAFMDAGERAKRLLVYPAGYLIATSKGRMIPLGQVPAFSGRGGEELVGAAAAE